MALVKWRPSLPAATSRPWEDTFWQDVERMFDEQWPFRASESPATTAMWAPRVDLVDQDEAYVLKADLPGMTQEDIDIQFHNGVLTLKGQRKVEHEIDEGYHRQERAYGAFARGFTLELPVEADQITATYKDGVLEVRIPKAAEAQTKRIAIKAA